MVNQAFGKNESFSINKEGKIGAKRGGKFSKKIERGKSHSMRVEEKT
jgi:hypothetical protein